MGLIPRSWLMAGALAAVLAAGGVGYRLGGDACEARSARLLADARERLIRNAELASRAEAARLAAEEDRIALQQTLEDAAHADPATHPDCLPVERVLRLRDR